MRRHPLGPLANLDAFRRTDLPLMNKLEFLYWESVRRAALAEKEVGNHDSNYGYAKAGKHWGLIKQGPRPRAGGYVYVPKALVQSAAVRVVKPVGKTWSVPKGQGAILLGESWMDNPEALVIAIDPAQREELIVEKIKKELKVAKQFLGKARAQGAGRSYDPLRMAEALDAYDDFYRSNQKPPVWKLGEQAQSFDPVPSWISGREREMKLCEDRGQQLLRLGRLMIKTAKKGSLAWEQTFRLR